MEEVRRKDVGDLCLTNLVPLQRSQPKVSRTVQPRSNKLERGQQKRDGLSHP